MKCQTLVLQGLQSWHGICLCQGMSGIAPGIPVPVPKEFSVLTDRQRAIVQSTVPLLETGGEALITHFYQTMLSEYPEVRALFNMAHQQSGAQPRALAYSVLMYAKHIDRLEALGDLPAARHPRRAGRRDRHRRSHRCLGRRLPAAGRPPDRR
jgi:nitric oxide dioxygenase